MMGDWIIQTAFYLIGIMAAFNLGFRKGKQSNR